MRTVKTTRAQDLAHEERMRIINAPFPAIRRTVDFGATWAGCLVPRPFDGMFLSQREIVAMMRERADEAEQYHNTAYDSI